MSYLWSFHSFDPSRLEELLGARPTLRSEQILPILEWEESGIEEPGLVAELAGHLSTAGLSYQSLDAGQARAMDGVVQLLFSPEGLVQELGIEYESPDGVHPRILEELQERCVASGVTTTVLPLLVGGGRRAGQLAPEAPPCEYCLLSPDELGLLLQEVEHASGTGARWSEDYVPEVVEECLAKVLERIVSKGKAAAGLLG